MESQAMSNEEFFSRWSRRKREAAQSLQNPEQPATSAEPEAPTSADDTSVASTEAADVEEFDLTSLPPIESITAATDVAAFLRTGVPLELSRAALRRAWESDPAIRDFIGLAENAWDFNDPNAIPGFGPLDQTPEQVRELAARIVEEMCNATEELASAEDNGRTQQATESQSSQIAGKSADSQSSATVASPEAPVVESHAACGASSTCELTAEPCEHAALHKDEPEVNEPEANESAVKVHRTHGGALPH
jgi:hypothetical protein